MAQLDGLVSEQQVLDYERDGVVCLRGKFGRDWLDLLADGFERTKANPTRWYADHAPEEGAGRFITDLAMAHHDPEFRRFAIESPAAEIVARLMRSARVNFFFDSMWIKGARIRKSTNWHQDQPYYTVDGDQMCVLWLALDSISRESSLECVRGSHRWNTWFEPTRTTEGTSWYENSGYAPLPEIDNARGDYDIAAWEMKPGDCLVFHGLTLHGAGGNPQPNDRRAHSSVWLGDDATWAERPGPARPRFEGHGLKPGDPIDCAMFPRLWPREARV